MYLLENVYLIQFNCFFFKIRNLLKTFQKIKVLILNFECWSKEKLAHYRNRFDTLNFNNISLLSSNSSVSYFFSLGVFSFRVVVSLALTSWFRFVLMVVSIQMGPPGNPHLDQGEFFNFFIFSILYWHVSN